MFSHRSSQQKRFSILATVEAWKSYLNVRVSLLTYPGVFQHDFKLWATPTWQIKGGIHSITKFTHSLYIIIGLQALQKCYNAHKIVQLYCSKNSFFCKFLPFVRILYCSALNSLPQLTLSGMHIKWQYSYWKTISLPKVQHINYNIVSCVLPDMCAWRPRVSTYQAKHCCLYYNYYLQPV